MHGYNRGGCYMVKTKITVDEMLCSYVDELKKKIKLEKVILYGSRARGDALKNSDIDLIIISDDFERFSFLERLEFLELQWKYSIPIEAIGYTAKEYEEMSGKIGIISEVVKYGKEIYVS